VGVEVGGASKVVKWRMVLAAQLSALLTVELPYELPLPPLSFAGVGSSLSAHLRRHPV